MTTQYSSDMSLMLSSASVTLFRTSVKVDSSQGVCFQQETIH